eukprot:Plantae.Rhodophyta-Purpureofilum_apyrenoidigerum.ctg10899.p1 GENE.Plantae.Rhodophyta-Purpureofilum_apyrenoidigerum.ctg10899~~Plantae.Rhodophyta-Purpureofilum_apyrenoidigerum.ctg10899.p1  ORF type:complete len:340 (+),score=44.06 Plantae.Rhodophyta-Purpureofilum_apyrenoidigerum.ctg10899:288-1307(+)
MGEANVEEASVKESSHKDQPALHDSENRSTRDSGDQPAPRESEDKLLNRTEDRTQVSGMSRDSEEDASKRSAQTEQKVAGIGGIDELPSESVPDSMSRYRFSRYEFEPAGSSSYLPAGEETAESRVAFAVRRAEELVQEGKMKGQATPAGSSKPSESFRCFKEAIEGLEAEEKNSPDNRDLVWQIGISLLAWARTDPNSGYADEILEEACQRFMTLSQLDAEPDEGCFFNWGLALCIRAAQKSGDAALKLFNSACGKYDQAVKLNPESRVSWFNYGLALFSAARLLDKTRRTENDRGATANYYREALAKFDRAVELEPSNWKARDYRRDCQEALAWFES